jgi:hypothetical protein
MCTITNIQRAHLKMKRGKPKGFKRTRYTGNREQEKEREHERKLLPAWPGAISSHQDTCQVRQVRNTVRQWTTVRRRRMKTIIDHDISNLAHGL